MGEGGLKTTHSYYVTACKSKVQGTSSLSGSKSKCQQSWIPFCRHQGRMHFQACSGCRQNSVTWASRTKVFIFLLCQQGAALGSGPCTRAPTSQNQQPSLIHTTTSRLPLLLLVLLFAFGALILLYMYSGVSQWLPWYCAISIDWMQKLIWESSCLFSQKSRN